jgi:hypothetical protein
MPTDDLNNSESSVNPSADGNRSGAQGWFKVGAVAAASALVGGLAAAWYYRKTLKTLQDAEISSPAPEFRIPEPDTEFDI